MNSHRQVSGEASFFRFGRRASRWAARVALALALAGTAGAAAAGTFLGAGLTDVAAADRVTIAHPQPVQLLFQFQTKGAPNAKATKYLKQQVFDAVKGSGLFSEVSDRPTANGAILSIVINDVANAKDMKDAESQGFLTGATFFVAGSTVVDHYISTADYVSGPTATKISKGAQQSLVFQMGLINKAPTGVVKTGGLKDGLNLLVRQLVDNPLNDIGKDPGFQVADAASAPAATPVSASPVAPASGAAAPVPATPAPTATPAPVSTAAAPAATAHP